LLEHVVRPEVVAREIGRVLRKKGTAVVQLPNLQWFIEPHTKWPLLGFMPHFIRESIRNAINYPYINFNVTPRNIIRAFKVAGLTLVAKENLRHGMRVGLIYPPAYFLIFYKG